MNRPTAAICQIAYPCPAGTLLLASCEDKLILCDWSAGLHRDAIAKRLARRLGTDFSALRSPAASLVIDQARRELDEYFAGRRHAFDLPIRLFGTPFQMRVWEALLAIPYGETRTYSDMAAAAGSPRAVRAAGTAIGENALSILVPCHRVLSSGGTLGGYGGGLDVKRLLLRLEGALSRP